MGRSVHVAKRYEVEWGETADLDWSDEAFIDVLNALGADVSRDGKDGDEFEVGISDYYDAIENLRVYISDPHLLTESDNIAAGLHRLGMTAEVLIDTMRRYLDEADIRDGWLHFTSF